MFLFFVFPNNKNVIMSAQQAAQLSKTNVEVIPTSSVTQCMSCMLAFDEDADADTNKSLFEEMLSVVKSAQVTHAVRDTQVEDVVIKEGDYLSIIDGKIRFSVESPEVAVSSALELMVDDDSCTISLFYGADIDEETAQSLCGELEEKYPDCDIIINNGAQPVYHYLISVE